MPFTKGNKYTFPKGKSGNPDGCPKGVKQKITRVKESILDVFDDEKFRTWATTHPTDFYNLMVKIMPKELQLDGDIQVSKIILVRPAAKEDIDADKTKTVSG